MILRVRSWEYVFPVGLDSKTIARKFVDLGIEVVCFSADLAQADEADIQDVVTKMAPCGVDTILVDLKDEMAAACFEMIKAQAMYDGGYWNSTGIARAVTVKGILAEMQKRGCTVLAHGATGRGNDQMRFERYTNVLAPDMKIYAPWRDPALLSEFPGRKEMADYLNDAGIEAFPGGKKRYSTDANLAGLSYEAEDLESLETESTIVEPQMGVWPKDAPDEVESFTVRFESGMAVAINGVEVTPLDAMTQANLIGGRNGIGLKNALENRIIGTKSRGVYESPGMELLGYALLQVYQAVMDRAEHDAVPAAFEAYRLASLRWPVLRSGNPGRAGSGRRHGGSRLRYSDAGPLQGEHHVCLADGLSGIDLQRGGQLHGGERGAEPREFPGIRRDPECRSTRACAGRPDCVVIGMGG